MKRQRNTQQVKEHEKCQPSQTKQEEIGNLPEKEFRIMITKMIQNLENKMELQINRLETRIEKRQEMFNKDLEERKKSQLKMNKGQPQGPLGQFETPQHSNHKSPRRRRQKKKKRKET